MQTLGDLSLRIIRVVLRCFFEAVGQDSEVKRLLRLEVEIERALATAASLATLSIVTSW